MILNLILLMILLIVAIAVFRVILSLSGTAVKIIAHMIAGWILLTIVNILPRVNIPINTITLLISGFGGMFGTILLVIFYAIF